MAIVAEPVRRSATIGATHPEQAVVRHLLLALTLLLLSVPVPDVGRTMPVNDAQPTGGAVIVALAGGHGLDDSAQPVPRRAISQLFAPGVRGITPVGNGTYRLTLVAGSEMNTVARLLADPRVRFVEPDVLMTSLSVPIPSAALPDPNDSYWAEQEEMRLIEADRAWTLTTGAPDVVIAVLDTGVDRRHTDLADNVLPGYDFVTEREGAPDDQGHGTFTAGVIAARGNNNIGMAGVCWQCRILPLKILNQHGRGPVSAFSQAIRYAVDHGARVINVSAGSPTRSQAMEEAVEYARAKDVLIVAAVGNTGDQKPSYPAALEPVLAIAATGADDRPTEFSTFGSFVDMAAPGSGVVSALMGSGTLVTRADGSSASAAFVSGAAGLLLSLNPDQTADHLLNILRDTAVDIGRHGRDDYFGAGRLAVFDAALATLDLSPSPDVTVEVSDSGQARLVSGAGFTAGEPLRVWSTTATGQTRVLRDHIASVDGKLSLDLWQHTDLLPGPQVLTIVGERSLAVGRLPLTVATPSAPSYFPPLPTPPASDARLYFPETGHTLSGRFRDYWEKHGGLAIFGYPISEEFRETSTTDGKVYVVQYFERNRFEYHPELEGTLHAVQLGLLGSLTTRGRYFPPASVLPPDGIYFTATRHTLTGEFRRYWEENGDLRVFGYPISEPFTEDGRVVQYFERNRFELYPEHPPEHRVLLGLLGRDLAQRNGYLPTP